MPTRYGEKTIGCSEGAHQPHRPLCILERDGVEILCPQPVLEHKGGHPANGKPIRHLASFEVAGQAEVGSARCDDHSGSGISSFLRKKHGERGQVVRVGARYCGSAGRPQLQRRDAKTRIERRFGLRRIPGLPSTEKVLVKIGSSSFLLLLRCAFSTSGDFTYRRP